MNRRDFLLGAGALALLANASARAEAARILVLVELNGGNDGLNTVIPFADPRYAALRPQLAVPRERALHLDERLGLHPALEPLLERWRARDMAIINGVGYPEPNLSHFRSIEIWDTASGSRRVETVGWAARALLARGGDGATDAIVFGRPYVGPFAGFARAVVIDDPGGFAAARFVPVPAAAGANPALARVVGVQGALHHAGREVHERLQGAPAPAVAFPQTGIGGQLRNAARLIAAGTPVAAIKVALGSFDTHVDQRPTHERLLRELAQGLAAFREAMVAIGAWNRVLVLTYSEFGRRAAENANAGTDHGTAAPLFALGGGVRGGLFGRQPALDDLDNGNLKFAVDYRAVFAAALAWWGVAPEPVIGPGHRALDFV